MKNWSIKKILKEIAITLVMVFVVSIVLNYIRKPDTDVQIPNIKTTSILGQEILFDSEQNRTTVIHFWATWCPTCKLEAPNIERIKDKTHVITVAVNSGTDEALLSFMKERGYTYNVVNDRDGKLAEKFGVGVFPTTFIYNSKGELEFSEVGYSTTLGLEARINLID